MLPNYDKFKQDLANVCNATVTSKSCLDEYRNKVICGIVICRVMKIEQKPVEIIVTGIFDWSFLLLNKNIAFKTLIDKFTKELQHQLDNK